MCKAIPPKTIKSIKTGEYCLATIAMKGESNSLCSHTPEEEAG